MCRPRVQLQRYVPYALSKRVERLLSQARIRQIDHCIGKSVMSCFGMKSLTAGRVAYMSNGNGLWDHSLVQDPSLS